MKNFLRTCMLLTSLALFSLQGYAQQQKPVTSADSIHLKMVHHYGNKLHIDIAKAAAVNAIMEAYKTGLGTLGQQKELSEQQRKRALSALMAEKNRKLAELLTPDQLVQVIPSMERRQMQPTPQTSHLSQNIK